MADLSPEAVARAHRTIQAAQTFDANAERIAAETPDLPAEHVLVAVVDRDYALTGIHVVAHAQLVEVVPRLEGPEGWAMVFSHGADSAQVRHRASEMASIASQRIAMIERLRAKGHGATAASGNSGGGTSPQA